ncbi:MAG TPA: hypothetical protein VGP33_04195 [Chloroflexota bacterium]|nr:hypothetical protein [Chloroflexota bacterium]
MLANLQPFLTADHYGLTAFLLTAQRQGWVLPPGSTHPRQGAFALTPG